MKIVRFTVRDFYVSPEYAELFGDNVIPQEFEDHIEAKQNITRKEFKRHFGGINRENQFFIVAKDENKNIFAVLIVDYKKDYAIIKEFLSKNAMEPQMEPQMEPMVNQMELVKLKKIIDFATKDDKQKIFNLQFKTERMGVRKNFNILLLNNIGFEEKEGNLVYEKKKSDTPSKKTKKKITKKNLSKKAKKSDTKKTKKKSDTLSKKRTKTKKTKSDSSDSSSSDSSSSDSSSSDSSSSDSRSPRKKSKKKSNSSGISEKNTEKKVWNEQIIKFDSAPKNLNLNSYSSDNEKIIKNINQLIKKKEIRAINVKQPYASALVLSIKNIENRNSDYTGYLLVVSSKKTDENTITNFKKDYEKAEKTMDIPSKSKFLDYFGENFPLGAILGIINIKEVKKTMNENTPWYIPKEGDKAMIVDFAIAFNNPISLDGLQGQVGIYNFFKQIKIKDTINEEKLEKKIIYSLKKSIPDSPIEVSSKAVDKKIEEEREDKARQEQEKKKAREKQEIQRKKNIEEYEKMINPYWKVQNIAPGKAAEEDKEEEVEKVEEKVEEEVTEDADVLAKELGEALDEDDEIIDEMKKQKYHG